MNPELILGLLGLSVTVNLALTGAVWALALQLANIRERLAALEMRTGIARVHNG